MFNIYYLTHGFIASTRVFNLLTGKFELATRGFEPVTCGFEVVTRISELVTRISELVTCNSCFTFPLVSSPNFVFDFQEKCFSYCILLTDQIS